MVKYFLLCMLGVFCKCYLEIDIEFEIVNCEKIVECLCNNQDDFYVMLYLFDDLDIVWQFFFDNEYVVIVLVVYWVVGKQVFFQEFVKELFFLCEFGFGLCYVIEQYMCDCNIQFKVCLMLVSNEVICDLVVSGMGLFVFLCYVFGNDMVCDGILILNVEGFLFKQVWNVVYLSSKIFLLLVQVFMDELFSEGFGVD